jgi:hypothetical protein
MISTDPFEEATRVLEAADSEGVTLRATGGVAIATRCPSARRPPLARTYNDIDYVAPKQQSGRVERLFEQLGYEPQTRFNALNGHARLFFLDVANNREADVFIDGIRGCHYLEVADRLTVSEHTLAPADLLLSKLQVVETNRKDYLDIFALLLDCALTDDDAGISRRRLTDVCSRDWGWWRTVTNVATAAQTVAPDVVAAGQLDWVLGTLSDLVTLLADTPKSRRWKLRAKVGERVLWYERPEEIGHTSDPAAGQRS